MAQPIVNTVIPAPAEPRQQLLVTGTGFGFVVSAFFEQSPSGNMFESGFMQVFNGQNVLVTVPPDLPTDADYTVVLVTLQDEISVNHAGLLHVAPISGNIPPSTPPVVPDPLPLPDVGTSVGLDRLRRRTRLELVDPAQQFQAQVVGDAQTIRFELPVRHVAADTIIVIRLPAGGDYDDQQTLVSGTDYAVDSFDGALVFNVPPNDGDTIYVRGSHFRFFDDATLDVFIEDAFVQITYGRRTVTTNVSQLGYRQYAEFTYDFDTLPDIEILPTSILAKIFGLWVLATDSSYDIDISEDGASIPRSERYRQILGQIQAETARYNDIAAQLNIGLHRIEMATLRRVSRTTGRLIPVYVEKEYDDHSLPVRVLPGVDHGVGEGEEFVDPYYQAGASFGGGFGP